MLKGHASPSRQEVVPPGRLNLDRRKAGTDHIDGAQKTIVGIDDQKPVEQAKAAQSLDFHFQWGIVDPHKIRRQIDAGDLAAKPFGRPDRPEQSFNFSR